MHNRLKVRTTVEMEAIKKKKEQEKTIKYSSLMKNLLAERNSHCHDSLMSLSAEILHMNPDVSTVWNIRKEFLLTLKNDVAENMNSIVDGELRLTEACLHVNPKSYCAWYHRCWILNNFGTEKDWTKELHVCSKYLEMDERNFHCWDYRKYIVEQLKTQLEKELDFSLQKLSANFSNYSAWHYRSKLIPRIYSVSCNENLFQNDVYEQEISLVENAVYTDPNDQSAWFYHRWLLSFVTNPVRFIQAGFNQDNNFAWVVIYPFNSRIQVRGLGDEPWMFLNGNKFSNVLCKTVKNKDFTEDVKLYNERDEEIDSVTLSTDSYVSRRLKLKPVLTDKEKNHLLLQLNSFKKLSEMEKNSKWPVLAGFIIDMKLNDEPKEMNLEKLKSTDGYRRAYYSDLMSCCKIEVILSSITDFSLSFGGSNLGLTAFYHNFCFTLFKEVDFSKNPLGNAVICKLDALINCEILNLSECEITSIEKFPALSKLKTLDLSHNNIVCDTLPEGLMKCSKLEFLDIRNSFISIDLFQQIRQVLPKLQISS